MEQFSAKKRNIFISLLVVNLIACLALLTMELVEAAKDSLCEDQYTLYIGTNDKDTNQPELSLAECQRRVEAVCLQYISGFTIVEADGAWMNEEGGLVQEKTLICYINGATAPEIDSIVDQLLIELNQSAIMVEQQRLRYEYRGI